MTCNYPLNNFKTTHPPLCGQPALWRTKIGTTGRFPDLIMCEEHKNKVSRHLDWQKIEQTA